MGDAYVLNIPRRLLPSTLGTFRHMHEMILLGLRTTTTIATMRFLLLIAGFLSGAAQFSQILMATLAPVRQSSDRSTPSISLSLPTVIRSPVAPSNLPANSISSDCAGLRRMLEGALWR